MNYGRKNHPGNVQQEIFICYVLEKLRKITNKRERMFAFDHLMIGRNDVESIKKEVFKRWKR